jgi:hypothetical protein
MNRGLLLLVAPFLVLVLVAACSPATSTPASAPLEPVTPIPPIPSPTRPKPTIVPATPTSIPGTATRTPLPPSDWPMFRFGLDRSGYNPSETVLKPPLELKWEYKTKSKI